MLNLVSQIPLCALLAGLLGLYIGYLLAKDSCKDIEELNRIHH
jgi:hypothetical protein